VRTEESRDPGSLSRLLLELAEIPRVDLPPGMDVGLRPGTLVGRFIIEREIGRGGFGVVYAALDPELGRSVALKLLKPGSSPARKGGEWLRREAEAVARLGHANIVTLHDFGRGPGGAYLVFELLRGETLSARLRRAPLPIEELVKVALAVARALAHAHDEKVLHRDLKPANIFLCADGAVKVLDFGIAHLFENDGPSTGGTPAYMAPEQWWDETGDARSDLFALGVLLHEMLTGTLPFGKSGVGKEAPRLASTVPRDRAPARLRTLTASLTQLDPATRPPSAHPVVVELEEIEAGLRTRRHRVALVGVASVGLLLGAAGLAYALLREPPSTVRTSAAVADAENATGDPDLDRLAELVIVAVGESRRVQVLSRERLLSAGRAGTSVLAANGRVDARSGRLLAALAGASVLLVPTASRDGEGYLLQLRGESPEGGAPLFTASARSDDKDGIPAALDRLVATARRELRERNEDLGQAPSRLAAMTTSSLPAFRAYVEGTDCMAHPSEAAGHNGPARCGAFFERALGLDPAFALAHYQLAYLLSDVGADRPELRAHIDAALRSLQRLSRRDAAIILAWKAHLDGRDEAALAGYGGILAEHPDDRQVLFLAGDLLYHRGDWAGATPYFSKLHRELDPDAEWPLDHLARCLALTGHANELRELSAGLVRPGAPPAARRLSIKVLVWLGDAPGALALARRDSAASPSARHDLLASLVAAGEFDEAEQLVRELLAVGGTGPDQVSDRLRLLAILAAQGRFAEGWRLLQALPRAPEGLGHGELAYLRAQLAAGTGDLARLRDAAVEAVRLVPEASGKPLVLLAMAGEPELALSLAVSLERSSTTVRELEAVAAWRRGQRADALASVAQLEQKAPWADDAIVPAYLLAALQADGGEPSEVVAAVGRFQRVWPGDVWRGWAWTRALVLSAQASARLGRLDEARSGLERALAVLRRADPGLPLLAEARALRDRLGPAGPVPPAAPGPVSP
jgi:tetratricopeptide (TPR) repeat protein